MQEELESEKLRYILLRLHNIEVKKDCLDYLTILVKIFNSKSMQKTLEQNNSLRYYLEMYSLYRSE